MDINENATATPTSKPRLFRWALWWGLGIMVICLAILIVYSLTNPSAFEGADGPMKVYIYSMVYHYGIWAMVIYMGIFTPIIKIDTIYDSTTNKMELNIKSIYDPLSEDE